jgi:DNA-binding LacI/PurR family transcriptional regulator
MPRGATLLVDLLLRRAAGEVTQSVVLPGELVVRESSGGPP